MLLLQKRYRQSSRREKKELCFQQNNKHINSIFVLISFFLVHCFYICFVYQNYFSQFDSFSLTQKNERNMKLNLIITLTLSAICCLELASGDIEYTNFEELNAHLFDGDDDLRLSDQSSSFVQFSTLYSKTIKFLLIRNLKLWNKLGLVVEVHTREGRRQQWLDNRSKRTQLVYIQAH